MGALLRVSDDAILKRDGHLFSQEHSRSKRFEYVPYGFYFS